MTRFQHMLAAALALALLTPLASARPDFCEDGDAGSFPSGAQLVTGAGTTTSINGSLATTFAGEPDFEDMYLINIVDPQAFRATTTPPKSGASFNTRLWLFSAGAFDGAGLLGNDDDPMGGFPGSSILLPETTDGTSVVILPGLHYLAISGFANDPLAMSLPIFDIVDPFEISGPDGPGGGAPIDGWLGEGETGEYRIELQGVAFLPCADTIPCPAGAYEELEACGDDTNGGCESTAPAFEQISCGTIICGTSQSTETQRDTDWYELEITQPSVLQTSAIAQFPHGAGLIEYIAGTEGSGDCADLTGFVDPVGIGEPCETSVATTGCLPAGTYYVFIAQSSFFDNLCSFGTNEYTLEVTCQPCSCQADLDSSGDVGFNDLLILLASWGPCPGCPADLNGDDGVGFTDLLTMLSAWGPCPP